MADAQMHREVPVELSSLEDAFDHGSWELRHYLDLETGAVVAVADEVHRELEEIYGNLGEEGAESERDVVSAIGGRDVPSCHVILSCHAPVERHRQMKMGATCAILCIGGD